jgi:NTE family protein
MTDKISLALSGGGSRAMAFHAGVLRYLAEMNMLEPDYVRSSELCRSC